MKILNKGVIIITLFVFAAMLLIACRPAKADAATIKKYATQTIKLRVKASGKILKTVKRNTKVYQIKEGRRWAVVKYKGDKYVTLKRYLSDRKAPRKYTGAQLRKAGAIIWGGCKYTYYSQRVLPDPNNYLGIVGKHIDGEGFICDKWGYICLGSCTGNRGRIVPTPFGKFGKVYDAGYVGYTLFDCYTNW